MATKPYRLVFVLRSEVSAAGTTLHTITITAETKDEAIKLANDFCFSQPLGALCSAKLTDNEGEVVWWMQASGTSDPATPQKGHP